MIIHVNKKSLVIGLEWVNCFIADKPNVVATFKSKDKKQVVYLKGKNSDIAVGATKQAGYSAAALLAIEKQNALCVLVANGEYWVSSCIDGQPLSDQIITTKEEAAKETRGLLGVMENIQILGNQAFFNEFFPESITTEIDWNDLLSSANKETLKITKTKKLTQPIIQYAILALLLVAIAVIYWPETPVTEIQIKQQAWDKAHQLEEAQIKQNFTNTIKNNPISRTALYVETILKLPVQVSAWAIHEINCTDLTCEVMWEKQDASGTFSEFKTNKIFNPERHLALSVQYAKAGDKINTSISLKPDKAFNGDLGNLLLKEQFFTDGLQLIQTAQKTKLITLSIETENLSPRQTPAPDGRQLEPLQYYYGSWLITGKGLLTIRETANTLKPNLFSVIQLIVKPNLSTMTTWELRGSYAYK